MASTFSKPMLSVLIFLSSFQSKFFREFRDLLNLIRMNRKALMIFGVSAIVLFFGIVFVTQFNIKPTDVKISEVLERNKGKLLGLLGVVGAGIARDENNHIIGIAVYMDDEITDNKKIPSQLGGFKVYIKRFDEISDIEKSKMIIRNSYFRLLNIRLDKSVYRRDETLVISIQNLSNETFTFGDSSYGSYFERWDGKSWKFYAGMISSQVITNLNSKGEARITYELSDKPFSSGKYRVVSKGWIEREKENIRIWGYAEFTVL